MTNNIDESQFTDEAGVLGLLAGLAAYGVAANPTHVGQLFGPRDDDDREDKKAAREAGDGMQGAAANGNRRAFLKHFVRLPGYMRIGLHKVAKNIRSGQATVSQYSRALKRAKSGAVFSLKRSVVKTLHNSLAENKRTYTGKTVNIKTKRGKVIKLFRNRPFAVAPRKIGGGALLQTYHPLQMNVISESDFNMLMGNSTDRKKPMLKTGVKLKPKTPLNPISK